MISREAVLLVLFFCISVIGGTGYLWIKDDIAFTDWWMIWNALGYPVLFATIRLQAKDFYTKLFSSALLALSCGEVLDEFISNPTIATLNEYVFFGSVVIYVIYKCTKKRN